jgi:hypothetical protein
MDSIRRSASPGFPLRSYSAGKSASNEQGASAKSLAIWGPKPSRRSARSSLARESKGGGPGGQWDDSLGGSARVVVIASRFRDRQSWSLRQIGLQAPLHVQTPRRDRRRLTELLQRPHSRLKRSALTRSFSTEHGIGQIALDVTPAQPGPSNRPGVSGHADLARPLGIHGLCAGKGPVSGVGVSIEEDPRAQPPDSLCIRCAPSQLLYGSGNAGDPPHHSPPGDLPAPSRSPAPAGGSRRPIVERTTSR